MALYLEHFGMAEPPFRITPHPDFFFDGADRGATLEGLIYAILHDEGIVKVSGEIGSGKTTLCRVLMERLPPEVEIVFLANPSYSRSEILHAIADEFGLPPSAEGAPPSALRDLQNHLIELYASGKRVVVLIDEAHAMPEDTLEQVRLLSNLESSRHKLLQIVLFGQPELDEALAQPSLRQLKDRITHSFRTRPLSSGEAAKYISHRMRAAGYRGPEVFAPAAVVMITKAASGLTRRINVLADKALLAAFAAGTHAVTPREVRTAVADSEFAPLGTREARNSPRRRWAMAAGWVALGALAGAAAIAVVLSEHPSAPPPAPQPATPAKAAVPAAPAARPEAPLPGPPALPPTTPEVPAPVSPPSDKALPEPPPRAPGPRLTQAQLHRFSGYSPGPSRLLKERLAATRTRLLEAPDEHHTIELFVAENADPARTERFLLRAREMVPLKDILVVPVPDGTRYLLRVTFGDFATREAAMDAQARLPPKYQQAFVPAPRSFAELRADLRPPD